MTKRKLSEWQKHVKTYMQEHKGLSFKEALPKAKLTYKKGSNPSPSRSEKHNPDRKKGMSMAKKKVRRRRTFTLPLAVVTPIIATPFVPPEIGMGSVYDQARWGNWDKVGTHLLYSLTGYWVGDKDKPKAKFDLVNGGTGLKMILLGSVVHWIASKLGVNRYLGRAKVPIVRV